MGSLTKLTTNSIKDGEVKTADINNTAVTEAKLASDSVVTAKITDGTIAAADLNSTLDLSSKTLTLPNSTFNNQFFNVALLGFKMAVQDSLTVFNLVDGVVDEFHDESGTDEAEGTNDTYCASNDKYVTSVEGGGQAASTYIQAEQGSPSSQLSALSGYTAAADGTLAITVVGGAGAGNPSPGSYGSDEGGAGALVGGTIEVSSGDVFDYYSAEPGANGLFGSGGGGATAVFAGEQTDITNEAMHENALFVGGGGGGTSGPTPNSNDNGGNAGFPNGFSGGTPGQSAGNGGTQTGGGGGGGFNSFPAHSGQNQGGKLFGGMNWSFSPMFNATQPQNESYQEQVLDGPGVNIASTNTPWQYGGFGGGGPAGASNSPEPGTPSDGYLTGGGGGAGYYGGGAGNAKHTGPESSSNATAGGGGSSYYGGTPAYPVSSARYLLASGSRGNDEEQSDAFNPDPVYPNIKNAPAGKYEGIAFTLTPDTSQNLTVVSNAFTAGSAPSVARIVVFADDLESITVNTDLVASVSRDGGSNFTAATLVDEGYVTGASGQRVYAALVTVSGQPSGTSMRWKLTTANTKKIDLHGVSLAWA